MSQMGLTNMARPYRLGQLTRVAPTALLLPHCPTPPSLHCPTTSA